MKSVHASDVGGPRVRRTPRGYHCATILLYPDRVGITEDDQLELTPTKTSCLFALADF